MDVFEQKKYSTKSIPVIFIVIVIFSVSLSIIAYKELYALKDSYSWINHTFKIENEITKISDNLNELYIYTIQNMYDGTVSNDNKVQAIVSDQKELLQNVIQLITKDTHQKQNIKQLSGYIDEFNASASNKNINFIIDSYKKTNLAIKNMLLQEQQLLLERQNAFKKKTKISLLLFLVVIVITIGIFVYSYLRLNSNRQKLRKTRAFLSGILTSTDNIISYFKPVYDTKNKLIDFKIIYTNEDIKDVIGENFSQIKGKLISDVYPTLFTNGVFEIYHFCIENPGKLKNYVRDFSFNGENFWFDSSVVELDGGVVISSKNITALKTSEQKTKKLNKQLTIQNETLLHTNEELEAFSRIASHDLQEPLRKIQMFISRVFDGDEENLTKSSKKYLVKTKDAAERMQNLIKYLLTYSRVNRRDAKLTTTSLDKIINEVKKEYAEILDDAGAIIKSDSLPKIKGISFQLEQLFNNLVSNSVKYREPSRPLVIKITSKKVPASSLTEEISKSVFSTYHCVEITDNGIGFDEESSYHIFEIFQRLHLKEEYSGYGIGLSICKKIMHFHDGYITAYGKKNKGATFQLYFPVMKID